MFCVKSCSSRFYYKVAEASIDGTLVCQKCSEGIKSCLLCSDDSLSCSVCERGFFPTPKGKDPGCLPCSEFLNYYSESERTSKGLCLECGIAITPGCKTCVLKPPTCLECTSPLSLLNSKCETCVSAEYFTESSGFCLKCSTAIPDCAVCNQNPNKCSRCTAGYYLKKVYEGTSTICVKCSEKNEYLQERPIGAEEGTGLCLSCAEIFAGGCLTCDKAKNTCLTCSPGRFLFSASDSQVFDRCVRCDGFDLPERYRNIKNGVCEKCSGLIEGCARCLALPQSQCLQCTGDLALYSTHRNSTYDKCLVCDDNDDTNNRFLRPATSSLGKGYNVCLDCSDVYPNCSDCDNEKCFSCSSEELILGQDMKSCAKCQAPNQYVGVSKGLQPICSLCSQAVPFCEECYGNSLSCSKCSAGYFRFSTKEEEEEDLYDVCVSSCSESHRYIDVAANNTCRHCKSAIEGCEVCNGNPRHCIIAKEGFYLISSKGNSIYDKTTFCKASNEVVIDSKICSYCTNTISLCEACNSKTSCTQCSQGQYLYSSLDNGEFDRCVSCDAVGQYVFNSVCNECSRKAPGCEKCAQLGSDSIEKVSCLACKKDQFPISTGKNDVNDKCAPCSDFTQYHSENDRTTLGLCLSCDTSFKNCEKCSESPFACSQCASPLVLLSSKNSSYYDTCVNCDGSRLTFEIKNGNEVCVYCGQAIENCLECSSGKPKSCNKCQDGYFLQLQVSFKKLF
jgi:proprotein convertase subtilisin/kexin type 5